MTIKKFNVCREDYIMHAIRAIYDGTNFKPKQPIPVKENYEVIITFVEPVKETRNNIMDFAGIWKNKNVVDLEKIMRERENLY